jgi:hypothetical protein
MVSEERHGKTDSLNNEFARPDGAYYEGFYRKGQKCGKGIY